MNDGPTINKNQLSLLDKQKAPQISNPHSLLMSSSFALGIVGVFCGLALMIFTGNMISLAAAWICIGLAVLITQIPKHSPDHDLLIDIVHALYIAIFLCAAFLAPSIGLLILTIGFAMIITPEDLRSHGCQCVLNYFDDDASITSQG